MSNTPQGGPPAAPSDKAKASAPAGDADARAPGGGGPLVLALDTASDARSVAVAEGARVLSLKVEPAGASGASLVLSLIDSALREAGVEFAQLGLFAAAVGPGSFTGLRAGLATVKAFAATTGRPVAGVPTLHAVAAAAGASARTVAAIPAGRGEVFAQVLRVAEDGSVRELSRAAHVKPAALVEELLGAAGGAKWVGGGSVAHADLLREAARRAGFAWRELTQDEAREPRPEPDGWTLVAPVGSYAGEIARLGLISFRGGSAADAESLRALYVRLSDAELKERCHA